MSIRASMHWMFFLCGFTSMAGQVVLLREVLVIFHGTEISIGLFLAAWLTGIGIGASVGARFTERYRNQSLHIFLHCFVFLGFSLIPHVVLIRSLPGLFGVAPAQLAPLHGVIAAVPAASFVPAFLTGFLFPIGVGTISDADDRIVARLYVYEALGGLAGGLLFTFVLVKLLPPLKICAALALVMAGAGLALGCSKKRFGALVSAVPVVLCSVVLLSPLGKTLIDRTIHARWSALHTGLRLIDSRPTPYQQVEVAKLGRQISLFGNGQIVGSFPDVHSANRLAALVMSQKPDAKQVLIIGGGIGGLVRALLHYPVERIDVVEPDPDALSIAQSHMSPMMRNQLNDPRVHFIFGDGRLYVNRLSNSRYDTVLAIIPDPVSSFWNRYYTLDYFQAVRRALHPRGLFVTGVTSAENFWGSAVASYAGSVYHTLTRVFRVVKGTPGDETLFFASQAPDLITFDPLQLQERFSRFQATDIPFDPAGFHTLLPPRRTAFVDRELQRSPVIINTDFNPVSSSLAMILWGKFSGTGSLEILNTIRNGGMLVVLIPLVAFAVAVMGYRARQEPGHGAEGKFNAVLAMAATGSAAMGMQIVLIYSYQSLFGYVFERIGLISGTFMIGLALGGLGSGYVLPRIARKERILAPLLLGMSVLCLVVPLSLRFIQGHAAALVEASVFAFVFVSAVITGAIFPLAASRHAEISGTPAQTSGWIDAADHYGAAVGALLAGIFLVPLLGMERACLILALLLVLPALLIGLESMPTSVRSRMTAPQEGARRSFPFPRLSWFLASVVMACVAWRLLLGAPGPVPQVTFDEPVLKESSGSSRFQFKQEPYPHYVGADDRSSDETVTLSTYPVAGEVRGYGGPINLLVSVSRGGTIRSLRIVDSDETPSYIRGIDRWLEGFVGIPIHEPSKQSLDAMTGATITCKAISKIVSKTGVRIAEPLLGLPVPSATPRPEQSFREAFSDIRTWAALVLFLFFIVAYHTRSGRMRLACLIAGFVVLGIFLNAPFTTLDVASLLSGTIPAAGTLWRNIVLGAIVLISLLWGQAFCGYLCPFGAAQEFVSSKRLRVRPSPTLETSGRFLKYGLLAILLSLFLISDDSAYLSFSPLQHFFGDRLRNFIFGRMDVWVLLLSATVLIASVFYFRFWCRYLCPAGAFLALFNKISLLGRWAPRTVPSRCDLGVRFPEDCDCIKCHRCLFHDRFGTEEIS